MAVEWCASRCQMSVQMVSDSLGDGRPPSRSRTSAIASSSREYTVCRLGRPFAMVSLPKLITKLLSQCNISTSEVDTADDYPIKLIKINGRISGRAAQRLRRLDVPGFS